MKYSLVISVLALLLVSTATTLAQQEAGDVELGLMGSYFMTTGSEVGDFGSGTIAATFGKFVSDHLEIAIAPSLNISTMSVGTPHREPMYTNPYTHETIYFTTYTYESQTTTTFGASAFLTYSILANAKTVPYVGAAYFRSDFSNGDDSGSAGMNFGVKFFISRKTAMDLKSNYLFSLNSGQTTGIMLFTIGLNFLL